MNLPRKSEFLKSETYAVPSVGNELSIYPVELVFLKVFFVIIIESKLWEPT